MKSVENEAVRIGGQMGKGALDALETFLKVLAQPEYKGKKVSEIVKDLNDKIAYENVDEYFQDQVANGINEFDSIGIEENQMSKFDQLAAGYGLKYGYTRKPDNIKELLSKTDLSESEKSTLNIWTKNVQGKRVEIPDDFKITFAVKDIPKIEYIVKDLREYVNRNLDERIRAANEKQKSAPQVQRDRTVERNILPDAQVR